MAKQFALGLSLRRMTGHDTTGKTVCLLCTEVPTLQNGRVRREPHEGAPDGLAVTFTLMAGLAWGDGAPVTAPDVAFTWKLAHDPATGFTSNHH